MQDVLGKLEKGRNSFVSYFSEKFEEEQGNKLKTENEEKRVKCREENNKIKKRNKIGTFIACFIGFVFCVASIYFLFNYSVNLKRSIIPLFFVFPLIVICGVFVGGVINVLFNKECIKEDKIKLHDIKKTKEIYLNNLKCSIDETKHYYDLLLECVSREVLNEKLVQLGNSREEIGSYNLILRLFENAIAEEKKNIKGKELCDQLDFTYKQAINKF